MVEITSAVTTETSTVTTETSTVATETSTVATETSTATKNTLVVTKKTSTATIEVFFVAVEVFFQAVEVMFFGVKPLPKALESTFRNWISHKKAQKWQKMAKNGVLIFPAPFASEVERELSAIVATSP